MFTQTMMPYYKRSVINPVGGFPLDTGGGFGGGSLSLTQEQIDALDTIERLYTSRLANKTYETIPTDFVKYLKLYDIVSKMRIKYFSNYAIRVLLDITNEGLTGSLNAFGLNTLNVELSLQNNYLQEVIEELISKVNVKEMFDENTGTISMTRKLELAPIFKYYIKIYGMPEIGVGFDPAKLNLVLAALENSGIDPYG
jgi:hypothetical protein